MNREQKLAALREAYGEAAVEAYALVGGMIRIRRDANDTIVFMNRLHGVFQKYGTVVVGEVIRLHAELSHTMDQAVRRDAPHTARLVERVAGIHAEEK